MQYRRLFRICIDTQRRFERRGAYCIDLSQIYTIQLRLIEMSWKFHAGWVGGCVLYEASGQAPVAPRPVLRRLLL